MHDHGVSQDSLRRGRARLLRERAAQPARDPLRQAAHTRRRTTPRAGSPSRSISTTAAPRTTARRRSSSRPPSERATSAAKPVADRRRRAGPRARDGAGAFNERGFPTAHTVTSAAQLWERAGREAGGRRRRSALRELHGPGAHGARARWASASPSELEEFVADGNLQWPNGRLPINTSGGNLGEAYIHGFEQRRRGGAPGPRRVDVPGARTSS